MYINIIHHKKIQPRVPSTTLIMKCIFKFSNFVTNIILSRIYSIHSNSSMLVEFFKIMDQMKCKANQIQLQQEKKNQDVISIHYQKFNCRNIIRVITILGGGLSVLSPYGRCEHKHKKVDSNHFKVSLLKYLYASIEFITS